MKRPAVLSCGAAVLFAAAALALWRHAALRAAAAETARLARVARLEKLGIAATGTEDFLALPPALPFDPKAARLGGELFHDKRLTAPTGRTCLDCHKLNAGGVDGKTHGGFLTRTVYNAAFADIFLSDASVTGLPRLVTKMITGRPFGGATNLQYSADWLASDIRFAYLFKQRYPSGVTVSNVTDALTAYVRSLVRSNDVFDRYVSGQTNLLSSAAREGMAIFTRQKCLSCHDGPLLGGWRVSEGRKVPALRGLSTRTRYLHDGARNDLSAVLPFMPGGDIEKAEERIALTAFLNAL